MIAVCATAWASGDAEVGDTATDGIAGNTSGTWASPDTPVAQGNIVTIYKEITAYNPETCTINAPTITYSYSITAGDSGKDIYDAKANHNPNANAHAYTKAGVGTPVITTSLNGTTFTGATDTDHEKLKITPAITMNASSTGTANKYKIHITFDPTAFTAAGIYRYVITETATSYESSGVVDGGISASRYLDVYVKDAATAGSYEIYGYVCFQNNNSIDARDNATTNTVTAAAKTEGFVATTTGGTDGATTQTADEYYTYNLTIKKTLENDQAMNSNKFPFKVEFANTQVTGNVLPIVTEVSSGKATIPTEFAAAAISSISFDGTDTSTDSAKKKLEIAHQGEVKITGIPVGTTATINEYNNVDGTIYTTKTSGGTTNETDGVTLNWSTWTNAVTGWDAVTALQKTANTHNVKADANMTVTFTNKLLQISPTGYVSRFAPYALILVAGIALLIVAKKRKPAKDDEE